MSIAPQFGALAEAPFQADLWGPLVGFVWIHRLPITGTDLAGMLEAHGFPAESLGKAQEAIDYGLNMLIWMNGRKPIRRRRVEPLSISRYHPLRRKARGH
jgi:hypothetical protein